ncbi:MAG: glutathione S-transferase family protein [Pseudomonadota bacterium]
MTEILLHNYPQSPVAEKVRTAFGIMGVAWASVEIPRLPPKPLLTELTGGYRRTPVMQIGADIFCDSRCILAEVAARSPARPLLPEGTAGPAQAISRWTDGALFSLGVKMMMGSSADSLPPAFAEDRGRLYLGPDWAAGLEKAQSELPHLAVQMRSALAEVAAMLSDGRAFLLGPAPCLADACFWQIIWFVRGRCAAGPALIAEFPMIEAWEARIAAIGHGTRGPDTDGEAAIAAAAAAAPAGPEGADDHDPQGLRPGMRVSVNPDVDGGEQPTEGVVRYAALDRVTILRESARAGQVAVHFPRAGYRVRVLDG